MIVGIEGTGSQGWPDLHLRRSFVRRIVHTSPHKPASYFIGPNDPGTDGRTIMDGAFQTLSNGAHNKPIVLVGYSRGAAYCLELCRRWKGTIDVLVMFDAVARQADTDIPDKVPGNVALCFHAYRDPRAGSRYFFGNVGLSVESRSTEFHKKMFYGSHGAIGGTWYDAAADEGTVGNFVGKGVTNLAGAGVDDRQHLNAAPYAMTGMKEDQQASKEVADWMWPLLIKAGVLPAKADRYHTAPPFTGSKTAGVRNMVR